MFCFDKEIPANGTGETIPDFNHDKEKRNNRKAKENSLKEKYERIRWEDCPIGRTPI